MSRIQSFILWVKWSEGINFCQFCRATDSSKYYYNSLKNLVRKFLVIPINSKKGLESEMTTKIITYSIISFRYKKAALIPLDSFRHFYQKFCPYQRPLYNVILWSDAMKSCKANILLKKKGTVTSENKIDIIKNEKTQLHLRNGKMHYVWQ